MNNYYPFINTPLPYDYDALEPFIDEKTMHLHHDRHLQTYIDNLNSFLEENSSLQNYSLEELLTMWCRLPCHLQAPLKNNAGGVYNHRFYFDGMKPYQRTNIHQNDSSRFFHEMTRQFGSPENFRSQFKTAALSVFGSGYAWLVSDNGVLKIVTSSNQIFCITHLIFSSHRYYRTPYQPDQCVNAGFLLFELAEVFLHSRHDIKAPARLTWTGIALKSIINVDAASRSRIK